MTDSPTGGPAKSHRGRPVSNALGHRRNGRSDRSGSPVEQLLECHHRHRDGNKVAALAHVVTPRAFLEFESVVEAADRLTRAGTVEEVVFETDAVLAVRCG